MDVDTPIINEELVKKAKQHMIKETEIYALSDFFKIFGDSTRLQILWALENNPLCVGDLCNVIGVTKSAASHQLKILKANKLVKYHKEGKNVIYALDDDHVKKIILFAREHLEEH